MAQGRRRAGPFADDRNLYTPVPESFENILWKTVESVRWSLANLEFEYLVRTNTSTFLNTDLLARALEDAPRSGLYQGTIGEWQAVNRGGAPVRYVSGSAAIMSRDVAEILAAAVPARWNGTPDDIAISQVVQRSGIDLREADRVAVTDFEPIRPCVNTRVKSPVDGSTTVRRMHGLHDLYLSTSVEELISRLSMFDLAERTTAEREGRNTLLARLALRIRQKTTFAARLLEFRVALHL